MSWNNSTLHQFFDSSLEEKIKTIYIEGEFIVAIRYYGYKINLYLLHDFMVEVFFNHKKDRIEKILLLDPSCTRMKFYTDQIGLKKDGLYKK
jgi:hypothetical protein